MSTEELNDPPYWKCKALKDILHDSNREKKSLL